MNRSLLVLLLFPKNIMKKSLFYFCALLFVVSMCACSSSDEVFDEEFNPAMMESANDVVVCDVCDVQFSLELGNSTFFENNGEKMKEFEKLEPNYFYTTTYDNIEKEFEEGHLLGLKNKVPITDWSKCKVVVVSGCFVDHMSRITSTHVYKKNNVYHVELSYVIGHSICCALGRQYTTAFILPTKDSKLVFHPVYAGENNEPELL